jgi:hypothetical protein
MVESPKEPKPGTGFTLGPERVGEDNWEWMCAEGFRPHETLSPEEVEHQRHVPINSTRTSVLMDQFGLGNIRKGDV